MTDVVNMTDLYYIAVLVYNDMEEELISMIETETGEKYSLQIPQ